MPLHTLDRSDLVAVAGATAPLLTPPSERASWLAAARLLLAALRTRLLISTLHPTAGSAVGDMDSDSAVGGSPTVCMSPVRAVARKGSFTR